MIKEKRWLKVWAVLLLAVAVALLPACQSETSEPGEATITFDGSAYSDTGSGTFFLEGTDGTRSPSGQVVLVISRNAAASSIYFEAEGYEEQPLTYFFVDGELVAQNNIPGKTIGILTVPSASLTEGTHRAEAIQFSGDTVGGEVVSYKLVEFIIQYEEVPTEPLPAGDPSGEPGGDETASE